MGWLLRSAAAVTAPPVGPGGTLTRQVVPLLDALTSVKDLPGSSTFLGEDALDRSDEPQRLAATRQSGDRLLGPSFDRSVVDVVERRRNGRRHDLVEPRHQFLQRGGFGLVCGVPAIAAVAARR
jgi:hypothetical protein